MEMTREMFFDGHNLKTNDVAQIIASNPSHGVEILDYIGEIMRNDSQYEMEKKWLKMKYDHDMKELGEKYGCDLDDNY